MSAQGAFPLLVKHLLPPGLRGIVVAGLLGGSDVARGVLASGALVVDGDAAVLPELLALLDEFEFWFNIVTP